VTWITDSITDSASMIQKPYDSQSLSQMIRGVLDRDPATLTDK